MSVSENISKRKFILPIKIQIDPMERLLVASFKGDDEFTMLEPQIFNDAVNGKGMRILRYRKDNKVDIYWQKGVYFDKSAINIGAGIGDASETIVEPSRFEFTEHGVDLHFAFTDVQGRKVELKIKENLNANNGFPFLAPVGNDVENPTRLFLVNMLGFDFVRKKGTEIIAKIGDRTLRPESFPIPRNFQSALFMRYSTMPVIGVFNPPSSAPIVFEQTTSGSVEIDGMKIFVDAQNNISRIYAGENLRKVEIDFFPGFPNLYNMQDCVEEKGRWKYYISGMEITGGSYSLLRKGNTGTVEIDVTENWKPSGLPLSFKIFTSLARFFRTWPATYKWNGVVELGEKPFLSGVWKRKK